MEQEFDDDAPVDKKVVLDKINSMIDEAFFDQDLMSDIVGEYDRNRKSGELQDATLEPLGLLLSSLLTTVMLVRQPIYTICEIKFVNSVGDFIIRIK
tara:strand:+ start:11330 stop:11620 length:291 start_codon:yes stop_codon:yes gene_type:complete